MVLMLCDWILTEFQIKGNKSRYILQPNSHFIATQGLQICQIWRILRQNCSDDSAEVTEGVTSTPEIFGNKQGGTSTPEGKLWSKFTQWPPSGIWAFQVSGPPQLLRVSLTIVYACQDHVLESLKMAFFFVILDSKYSKMTPKFMKQKSHWLQSSIKFANPVTFFAPYFLSASDWNASYSVYLLLLSLSSSGGLGTSNCFPACGCLWFWNRKMW